MKKDYIPGLGNIADFVVINECRGARDKQKLDIKKLW
jgi:hypothetical protein